MTIMNRILQYIPSFIECFILWRLMCSVLESKYIKHVPIVIAAGMFLILHFKQMMSIYPTIEHYQSIITAVLILYILVSFQLLFKNSFMEKLIWCGVYSLGLMAIELITIMVMSALLNQPIAVLADSDQISILIIITGKLLTVLAFENIFRRRQGHLNIGISYFRELAIIVIFNLVLVLVLVSMFYNRQDLINKLDNVIIVFSSVVLLITVYTVALIFRIEKKSNEELATQLKLQQIELELKLNIDMVTITDKLRKLRHDMNNHIGLMKTLAQNNKYDELEEYMDEIYEDVEVANDLVLTENKTLSVLLNAKKSLAKEKNIKFTSIIATQEINMQSKDICSLLGNILDNAIDAAERAGNKKYIQLLIKKTSEGCVINCENTFGLKPIMKKGRFITRKENNLIHGIGTENIKDIVAKYNGEISFEYDDEIFNVNVLLPI